MLSGNDKLSSYKEESLDISKNKSHHLKKSKVDSLIGFKPVNRLNKFVKNRISGGAEFNNFMNERA